MTPPLSIVMASHNDTNQTALTLASIRETAPEDVEVVIVDDCSSTSLHHYIKSNEHTKLITNRQRCGCGPSRHIGALNATSDWLLICDSHMRFTPGWFEEWGKILDTVKGLPGPVGSAHTVFCATCLGLDSKHMDPAFPVAEYHGATMNFMGPDRANPSGPPQVFEAVWIPKAQSPEDGAEIPAVMGAAYFVSRAWFLHISPLRFLRTWGCDEQMISLKTWLAGGSVRMAKTVRIGHKFLVNKVETQQFGVQPGHIIWNKLFAIHALPFPPASGAKMTEALLSGPDTRDIEAARRMFRDDYHLIAQERAENKALFTNDLRWYCDKFGIPLP